jgi:DNA topoisomerase I
MKSAGTIIDKPEIIDTTGPGLITPSGARVPPAWTDVWITTDPESHIQATGHDSKGRRVYLYSAEHMGRAAVNKFSRLREFARMYPILIKHLERDRRKSEAALVLYLIAKTGFRIGSNTVTLAAAKAFGASTLHCFHVSVRGEKISFDYTGKKGKQISKVLKYKFLAKEIAERCSTEASERIFRISDKNIRKYLSSIPECSGFTVKDFRTYFATLIAFHKIKTLPIPQNLKEFRRFRKEVAETVARELGNTPIIALNSYITPEVFCGWESGQALSLKEAWGKRSFLLDDLFECIYYDEAIFGNLLD